MVVAAAMMRQAVGSFAQGALAGTKVMLVRRFSTRAPPEGFGESFTRHRVHTKIYTFLTFWWLVLDDVFLPFFDRVGISLLK